MALQSINQALDCRGHQSFLSFKLLSSVDGTSEERGQMMGVLDLKVLATREVLKRGLDFSDHLAGRTRQELEDLSRMVGVWKVETTDLLVKRCNGDPLTIKESEKLLYEPTEA